MKLKSKTSTPVINRNVVVLANHHTATILFPRKSSGGRQRIAPITINPGKTVSIEKDEWDLLRKSVSVQNYLDAGLISVTKKESDKIPVMEDSGSVLVIPEHLLRDDEDVQGSQTEVTAKVRRKNKSSIQI